MSLLDFELVRDPGFFERLDRLRKNPLERISRFVNLAGGRILVEADEPHRGPQRSAQPGAVFDGGESRRASVGKDQNVRSHIHLPIQENAQNPRADQDERRRDFEVQRHRAQRGNDQESARNFFGARGA